MSSVVCDFNVDVGECLCEPSAVGANAKKCIIGVEVEYMFPSTNLSTHDIQTICFSR